MDSIQKKIITIIDSGIWHPTQRSRESDGAAGETLELLLGIEPNNNKKSDTPEGEIKTFDRNSTSKITLLSKEPMYQCSVREDIFNKYSYPDPKSPLDRCCNIAIKGDRYNNRNLKLEVDYDERRVYMIDKEQGRLSNYWSFESLQQSLQEKHGQGLLNVGRESRINSARPEYRFTSLTRYANIEMTNFLSLIEDGTIGVELRMRSRSNHRTPWKNRGTAFRIPEQKLPSLYKDTHTIRNIHG